MNSMKRNKKRKKRMGRPRMAQSERRLAQWCVRMTQAERKVLEAEAKMRGLTVSDLLMRPWRKKEA